MYKHEYEHDDKLPAKCDVCGTKTDTFYILHRLDIKTRSKTFILAKDLFEQNLCVLCLTLKIKERISEATESQEAEKVEPLKNATQRNSTP